MALSFTLASPQAAAQRALRVKQFGGNATWDRLAEHLEEAATGRRCFVIHRSLAAPIARIFEMWANPEQLAQWLPPPGTTMRFVRSRIAVGQSSFFTIAADRTRITLTCESCGEATDAEIEAFVRERPGMTLGWNSSFDALEALVLP